MFVPKYVSKISEREFERFRKMVQKSGGNVMLLVHPHFFSQIGTIYSYESRKRPGVDESEEQQKKDHEIYLKRINNAIKNTRWPLIVLESYKYIRKTNSFVKSSGKKALMLPTFDFDSDLREKGKERVEGAGDLIKILNKIGAKKLYLGGSISSSDNEFPKQNVLVRKHERKWLPKRLVPSKKTIDSGCLGAVYRELIVNGNFERVRLMPNLCFHDVPKHTERPNFKLSEKAKRKIAKKLLSKKVTKKPRTRRAKK